MGMMYWYTAGETCASIAIPYYGNANSATIDVWTTLIRYIAIPYYGNAVSLPTWSTDSTSNCYSLLWECSHSHPFGAVLCVFIAIPYYGNARAGEARAEGATRLLFPIMGMSL